MRVLLSGSDCYALRCALSHQGSDDISTQRARDALNKFQFVASGGRRHLNLDIDRARERTALQLDVGVFCEGVCLAVPR